MRHRAAIGVMWAAAVSGGCSSYSVYGYQYRLNQQFGAGEHPDEASVEAEQLLSSARTVAFFPPDYCVNTESGEAKAKELRARCGVLLSELERGAERAGYEVVSWQNLRGPNKRPIDFARDSAVDVLFEINEFTLAELSDSEVRTLTFFERADNGDEPLPVSREQVAKSCEAYAVQRDPPRTVALSGTIDIKTVSVSDGRDRWHYQKELSQSLGHEYPKVAFKAERPSNVLAQVLAGVGGAALGIGAGLAIGEAVSTDNPSTGQTKFDSHGWSTGLLVGGAVGIAGAIAVQIAMGNPRVPPDQVLCRSELAEPTPVAPPPPDVVASEHTFQANNVDQFAKQRARIQEKMIAQFVEVLKHARRSRPSARPLAPSTSPQPVLSAAPSSSASGEPQP